MRVLITDYFSRGVLLAFFLIINQPVISDIITEKKDTINAREWIHLDPSDDGVAGVGLDKAYQLLEGRPSRSVLVAVIDSGFDLEHEDLKGNYWINENEIPDNGIDDDGNGYVDDIHGWNFIGGPEENVIYDTYELTREYKRLEPVYRNKKDGSGKEYNYWLKIRDDYEIKKGKAEKTLQKYSEIISNIPRYYNLLMNYLDVDSLTLEAVNNIATEDSIINQATAQIGKLLNYFGNGVGAETMVNALTPTEEHFLMEVNFGYNTDYDPRHLVDDNYQDKKERIYGNNQVYDHSGMMGDHGTHVAGIIAAKRDNEIGARGVADNVKILPLRTVPNGDERDKDVANAIYYAVDNGAKIINMSFGKSYSPDRKIVEKAIRYAEKKDVLIVHAAGNNSENKDIVENFPTRKFIKGDKEAWNMIEVGASSRYWNEKLTAKFSNYGESSVDLFAPGVYVYSTLPGNQYKEMSGTSMAAPVVSGVAAMLFSYFPELSAKEVREVLLESVVEYDGEVYLPGTKELTDFSGLSITGGLINAFEAIKIAQNKIKLEAR
jgi:subtilisin family serine protease